jgi:hypothetical protein
MALLFNERAKRLARPRPATGELVKALIVDTGSGTAYPVMYNPEELKLEQGNAFAEIGIPGLNVSPIQYVRGRPRILTMELFFDSYETGEDVRNYTAPIVALLDKQPQTQAPPVLLFSLGRLQFRCVLVDAGQRYTMFLRDGTPVRSTMSVRLHEYVEVELEVRQGIFFGSPTVSAVANQVLDTTRSVLSGAATVHLVVAGDTLSGLAGTYLGDPGRWRVIADANAILDPLDLVPGTALVVPTPDGPARGGRR